MWAFVVYTPSQLKAPVVFILEMRVLTNGSLIFAELLARIWSPPNREKNIWHFSSLMLGYVQQLVANFVCRHFDAAVSVPFVSC